MNWSDAKDTVVGILKEQKYKEVPYNKSLENAPASLGHKVFSLRPIPSDKIPVTSGGSIYSLVGRLRIMYAVKDTKTFDTMYDEFRRVLKLLEGYNQLDITPQFEMENVNEATYAIGQVDLLIGRDYSYCN